MPEVPSIDLYPDWYGELTPTQKRALKRFRGYQFVPAWWIHKNTARALKRKGLIESRGEGFYKITPYGVDVLRDLEN